MSLDCRDGQTPQNLSQAFLSILPDSGTGCCSSWALNAARPVFFFSSSKTLVGSRRGCSGSPCFHVNCLPGNDIKVSLAAIAGSIRCFHPPCSCTYAVKSY